MTKTEITIQKNNIASHKATLQKRKSQHDATFEKDNPRVNVQ